MSAEISAHTTAIKQETSMRGIIAFVRRFSFEVREFGFADTLSSLGTGLRCGLADHAGLYRHPDGRGTGTTAYLRVPFTRLSMMLEWVPVPLGRDVERTADGWDVYFGQLKASFCIEQGELYRASRDAL
jgi:hypothetical protein